MLSSDGRSEMQVAVGIDVAKELHWATAVDERGGELLSSRIDNDPAATQALIDELEQLRLEHGALTVGIDVVGGIASLLTAMLVKAGFPLVHVPGLAVNRARRGTTGGEHKSDPRDARVIADQIRTRTDLRPVEQAGEADVELRLLVGRRRELVTDQTRRIGRLRDLLAAIHPGLERIIDPTQKASLLLLSRYVTPAEIRRGGVSRLVKHMLASGRLPRPHVEKLAAQAVAAAKAQQLALPGERLAAALVRELAEEALSVRERLAQLDSELKETLARHPDAAFIRSLPGMGATLAAEFIAEAGGISRFPTPDRLAAAAGLAPILKQSGKVLYLRRANGGNKASKRVLYQPAFCSLSHPTRRAFYARKRSEGKRHHQAVLALARRRVDVLHAILRTRQPYRADYARAT